MFGISIYLLVDIIYVVLIKSLRYQYINIIWNSHSRDTRKITCHLWFNYEWDII